MSVDKTYEEPFVKKASGEIEGFTLLALAEMSNKDKIKYNLYHSKATITFSMKKAKLLKKLYPTFGLLTYWYFRLNFSPAKNNEQYPKATINNTSLEVMVDVYNHLYISIKSLFETHGSDITVVTFVTKTIFNH